MLRAAPHVRTGRPLLGPMADTDVTVGRPSDNGAANVGRGISRHGRLTAFPTSTWDGGWSAFANDLVPERELELITDLPWYVAIVFPQGCLCQRIIRVVSDALRLIKGDRNVCLTHTPS